MRVIVTGGAGFIGSALCRHLVADAEAQVLNIDRLTYAANLASLDPIADHSDYYYRRADICDRAAVSDALESFRPDAVVHLAAESHVDRSIAGSDVFVQTNVVGTYTLLEAARDYWSTLVGSARDNFRFVHVSTDEVYGSLGAEGLFTETTPYDPSSPYSATKAASDHLVKAWQRTYGLPALVTNCSNNYGPCQFPEKLIPLMILNALHNMPLPIYGDGKNVRDWLFVEDHARAIALAISRGQPGETYNIGGRNERTNLSVVERICDLMDEFSPREKFHRDLIQFVADRPGHDARYAIDATKAETELGWLAQEDFESGIEKTVKWYLSNRGWWEPLVGKVYKRERELVL